MTHEVSCPRSFQKDSACHYLSPRPGAVLVALHWENFLVFTCSQCLSEQDGVGHEDKQQRQVRGDVVGDGVIQTSLTPEGGKASHSPKHSFAENTPTYLEAEIRG